MSKGQNLKKYKVVNPGSKGVYIRRRGKSYNLNRITDEEAKELHEEGCSLIALAEASPKQEKPKDT